MNRPNTGFIFSESFPFKDKDILFVGAAPILEEQMDWIKSIQDNFYILSSDTSCYALITNGIRPDFIISIDASRGTIYHFRDVPGDIPIITCLAANSYILQLQNPVFHFFSTYPLDQVLHSILFTDKYNILRNPSLNVAGIAKVISEKFLAKQLVLCGVSFKMQSGKTHCRGTGYENYNLPKVNRYFPMEAYIPHVYKKEISSKNQLALYHLTESSTLQVIKLESKPNITIPPEIYKTKPLSLKVSELEIHKFKKYLLHENIEREILENTGLDKKYYNRIIGRFL